MIGGAPVTVEARPAVYIISKGPANSAGARGLISATLKLSRPDLHALEETLVIRGEVGEREYRLSESGFDRVPVEAAAPQAFEPDAPPPAPTASAAEPAKEMLAASDKAAAPRVAPASADLEVELTYLLDKMKANQGEQISVSRTGAGKLLVSGIVDTDKRKAE